MICPYCRTPNLLHGITKQTKREIYECPACDTIWIGSVDPAHVSNFRKYKSDGIRVPDAAEIDIAGVKYPGHACHTLRHSCGTNLYRETKDLRVVQETLRHSSPEMTARYSHVDERSSTRPTRNIIPISKCDIGVDNGSV